MNDYLTDYEADADDRIIAALRARGCAFPDKLEPAARLAGAQLELLKPVVIGARAGRIYAGPAVMTKPGAILVVMATQNKVATTILPPEPGRNPAMEEIMTHAELMPERERDGGVMLWVQEFVERCGSQPGEDLDAGKFEMPDEPLVLVSSMFAGPQGREIFYNMDALAAAGKLCPAAVFLCGPSMSGRPNTYSVLWPITFALAPYIDAVVDAAEA